MIYIVLYSNKTTRGIFYAASLREESARTVYESFTLDEDIRAKELWSDDGNGYRQLLAHEMFWEDA